MRTLNSPPLPSSDTAARRTAAISSPADFLPALVLLWVVVAFRIWSAWLTTRGGALPWWLPGFCPIAALAMGSAWFLPRRLAIGAPLAMLLTSDLALTAIYGWQPLGGGTWSATLVEMTARYAVLFALAAWALRLRRNREITSARGGAKLLAATVLGSLGFYVVTNTISWLTLPGYAQTASGWWQALTTGLPGYPPSWIFFRNALVSDLIYSGMLLVAFRLVRRPATLLVPSEVATPAVLHVQRG